MARTVLEGNRFRVRVRDLADGEARAVLAGFSAAARAGFPAYFDDQRFGSLRGGGGFAMLHLLRGDPEQALRAVVTTPAKEDRAEVRRRKDAIRRGWGDWESVLPRLAGSPMRAAVLRLAKDPRDFVGALAALDREERRLLASAWQSSVWNRALSKVLEARLPEGERLWLPGAAGPLLFPRGEMPPGLEGKTLPLPAPGAFGEPTRAVEGAPDDDVDAALRAALLASLDEDGLAPGDLRPPPGLGMDLRPTRRPLVFRPQETSAQGPSPDDLNPGRTCVDLAFTLDRGQYATLILKRLTHGFSKPGRRRRDGPRAGGAT